MMSDIDEALAYFRRERKECEGKLHGHQAIPQFTENMQKAVQHMDTAIQALERQRELQDALKHTTDLLDSRDFAKRHYEMVQRVKDNRTMLAAAPKGFDSETAPYSGGNG